MPLGPRFAYAARRRLPRAVIVPHLHSVAFIATTLERMMRQGTSVTTDRLQVAAEALRATEANEPDDIYATLKARLLNTHGIRIKRRTIEEMTQALRVYDKENRVIYLSGALDYSNGLPTRSCGVPD
jgi:hypothetical protein